MSIQEGIKRYGQKGKDSVMKKIQNLAEKNEYFCEIEYDSLTQEMKDKALPLLLFMVMKRNSDLKTRGVANGKNQKIYTDKNDVLSLILDFNSLKYLCAVFAKEGRDTAIVNLPGFFLQTKQEDEVLIKLTGAAALLLVESKPDKWKKHLRRENGKWVIYAICDHTIYGTLNAALLSYKKLARAFKEWELVMNPYDPCVWNVYVNKKQLTIIFHVDDLMLAHVMPVVVTEHIKLLDGVYGTNDPLTVTRGKVHEFVGMTIDFSLKQGVAFSQYDYIKKFWNELPEDLKGPYKNTPALENLFKVDRNAKLIDPKRKKLYHWAIAKSLFLSQRSRYDMQLSTGFHCTRVKFPNV